MKTMKRVLSCVLAILLVVAALPLSASAAVTGKVGSITAKIVDIPNSKDRALFARASQREQNLVKNYPNGVVADNYNGDADTGKATAAEFQAAVAEFNKVIKATTATGSGTEASPYQIAKGSKFYVAIDIETYNADAGGFTTGMTPVLQFPKDAVTVNTKSIAHPGTVGQMCDAYMFEDGVGKYMAGATAYTLATAAYLDKKDKDGNATDRFTNQFSGGSGYLPTAGAWEALIEVTASGSAGKYYVEIAPEKTNANGGQVTAIPYNEGGRKDDGSYNAKTTANDGASTDNIDFGERVYFEIVSNDPAISITANQKLDPVDTATVAVTLKNGTWASTLNPSDFVVMDGASEVSNAVASVTRTSTTVATLTVKGSGLDASKNYAIKAKAATHTATSGDATTDITTAETFTVKEKLTGTVTLDADNSHGTAPVYGDTITATYSGNAVTPKYQWKVAGVNKGTDSATYTPVAADVTKTITCTVTDKGTNAKYGSVDSAATTALAKKTLTAPVAADITNVPAIKQGATTLTANGTYTFKTSNGLVGTDAVTVSYVATYQSSANKGAVNDVSVALGNTLAGAQAGAYTFAGATVTGVKGEVSESKYTLATTSTPAGVAVTYSGANVTGTTVSNAGGQVTGTISASALNGGVLSDVTITGATVTGKSITNDGQDGNDATFVFTLPSTTDVVTVNVAVTIGQGVTTVTFDNLNKTYDGTTEFKGEIATAGVTLEDFGITSLAYASADAANGVAITATPALTEDKVITKNDAQYKFPATLAGNIEKATATSVTATAEQVREGATIDDVVNAILGADVVANGITQDKVSAYADADDIKELLKAVDGLYDAATKTETEITDLTQSDTKTPAKIGDTYVLTGEFTLPDPHAGLEAAYDSETGKTTITVTGDVTANVVIDLTPADNTDDVTLTIALATDLEEGTDEAWNIVPGDYSVTITTDGSTGKLGTNFTGTPSIIASISVKKKGAAGGIVYNTNGYAAASEDEVQVEDGKIVALAEVTDVVKGASFLGWSTDGTKAHIVKVGAEVSEEQEELIAVFEGYMMGTTPTTMVPTHQITRAQLLKMVLVASGEYDANHDYGKCEKFTDSNDGWYTPYVACAEQMKNPIISGYEDGTFKPNRVVKREEAAKIIAEAFGVEVKKGATTDKVTDFDKVSGWAKDYVAALCENGTISGFKDGTFGGARGIQRDAASKMVNMYLGLTDADRTAIKANAEIKNPFSDVGKGNWAYADLMFASLSVSSDFYQTEITMPNATPATPAE